MNKAHNLVYLPRVDGSATTDGRGRAVQSGSASSGGEGACLCNNHEPCKRTFAFEKICARGLAPSPRGGISAVCIGETIFVFGGHELKGVDLGFAYHNDLYAFDTCKYTWKRIGKESYGSGHSCEQLRSESCGEAASPSLLAKSGGPDKSPSPPSTPRVRGSPPSPRYGHSAVAFGDRMIVFGGAGANGAYFNDLYAFDTSTYTWLRWAPGEEESQRCADSPPRANSISLSKEQPPSLDGERRRSANCVAPPARMRHAACEIGGFMFVFGGVCGSKVFADVWRFSFKSLRWQPLLCSGEGPPRRYGHQATPVGTHCIVIHGGVNLTEADAEQLSRGSGSGSGLMERIEQHGVYLQDVFVLQRSRDSAEEFAWFRLRTHGLRPPPRFDHSVTATREGLLLFGGWAPQQQTPQQLLLLQQQLPAEAQTRRGGAADSRAEAANETAASAKESATLHKAQSLRLKVLPLEQGAFLCRSCSTWRPVQWKTGSLLQGGEQLSRRHGHAAVDTPRGVFVIGGWSFPVPLMEVLRAFPVAPSAAAETDSPQTKQ